MNQTSRRPLDPRKVNVLFDANAFDQDKTEVERLLGMKAAGKITLIAPSGVLVEIQHRNTPARVQEIAGAQIFAVPLELDDSQQKLLTRIRTILQGNAKPGKHDADAHHVFEATKHGGGYFITHDVRINKTKRTDLEKVLPPSLWIVTLTEFLTIYDRFDREC